MDSISERNESSATDFVSLSTIDENSIDSDLTEHSSRDAHSSEEKLDDLSATARYSDTAGAPEDAVQSDVSSADKSLDSTSEIIKRAHL